ncbi:MAG: hypothetical protein H8D87_15770 [Deltaproteobacteria bacterium]|uniref:hypothetical protein n=1 Tax=Desulfobacula sp. TaxID=2593537 RepID=UPI0019C5A4EA|nr:hypothetical protein [Candidatus Desulfobacula maris]MBL6995058.1 hypothetical protein [Desulfobacula sp.]
MKRCHSHIKIKILKSVLLISLILFLVIGNVDADISDSGKWQQIHTGNTILCFQSLEDLHRFNTRISYDLNCKKDEITIDQKIASTLADTIAKKVDALFERSQEVLEMQGFTSKIIIKIFNNRQQLNHAFYKLYKKECNVRAWYIHEKLTVYIQLDDLHEGMLAHEFAHAIMNHYMIIPLPGKTAEILARYVDTNLHIDKTQKFRPPHINGYSMK